MLEKWLIDAEVCLGAEEFREGWRAYHKHRSGGAMIVGFLLLLILAGIVLLLVTAIPDDWMKAMGTERGMDDRMETLAYGIGLIVIPLLALSESYIWVDPMLKQGAAGRIRCNEFDVEVESGVNRRRMGWPEFFVFKETDHVYLLMKRRMFLIVPKRVVAVDLREWFRLMGEQSTQARRDIRRDFEVVLDSPKKGDSANTDEPNPPPQP